MGFNSGFKGLMYFFKHHAMKTAAFRC